MSFLAAVTSVSSLVGEEHNPSFGGALRYIYNAGTDVLAPVFRDPGLTTSMANPTRADAEGKFESSYLMDGSYDVAVFDRKRRELGRVEGIIIRSRLQVHASMVYTTLGELSDDRLLGYYGTSDCYELLPDDQIRVSDGDFSYCVAPEDAEDHHLETTHGIKLYVMPSQGNTWNLAAFGVDLTGETDESAKLQRAMDAASGGGTLYHPGGILTAHSVIGRAGVSIVGNGPKSVFRRLEAGGPTLIEWQDEEAEDVSIRNCGFDLCSLTGLSGADLNQGGAGDHDCILKFDDYREQTALWSPEQKAAFDNTISIVDNHFINSNKDSAGNWTLTGVICRGINGLIVRGNVFDGVQCKLAGGGLSHYRIHCVDNLFRECQAYPISCVAKPNSDTTQFMQDIRIADNVVYGNGKRGPTIFTGVDDGTGGELIVSNLVVDGNQLRGFAGVTANVCFLIHRGGDGRLDRNVVISNNVCILDAGDGSEGIPGGGMSISGAGVETSGNTVTGRFDQYAIASSGIVVGNTVRGNNRGIEATDHIAIGNLIDGEGVGKSRLRLGFSGAQDFEFLVRNNTIIDVVQTGNNQCPITLSADNGAQVYGSIAGNTIIDRGNTDHGIDFNENGGTFVEVLVCDNHCGAATLIKRGAPGVKYQNNSGGTAQQVNGPWMDLGAAFRAAPILPSFAATDVANAGHKVNTSASKTKGAMIFDLTDGRILVSTGSGTTAAWRAADGSEGITPV